MTTNRLTNIVLLTFLVLININFYDYNGLEIQIYKYFRFAILLFIFLYSLPTAFNSKGLFNFNILVIGLSILFSIFMAYFSWDQDLISSIIATTPYFGWFTFYLFLRKETNVHDIESVLFFLGILYIVLFFFQLLNYNSPFFGWEEEYDTSRGIARIIFPGAGVFFFTIFYGINKLTTTNKYKVIWFILTILGPIIVFLQATRQNIIAVFLIYLIHFFRSEKLFKKIVYIVAISVVTYYFIYINIDILFGLLKSQQQIQETFSTYIRVLSGNYYLFEFSPNVLSKIFGNGVPWLGNTDYGKFVQNYLYDILNYHFNDVGIIALYALFGIFAAFSMILIWVKGFINKVQEEYRYLKYYLLYLLLTSLTSYSIYNYNYLIVNICVLYIYQIKNNNYKQSINN